MTDIFAWVEQTPFSIWLREDLYAFFVVLIFHSLGMAFLVGGGMVICLRVAGLGTGARLEKFRGFFPVMWIGLVMAVCSGVLLLWSYPAKALTNPVFLVKFILLISAGVMMGVIAKRLFPLAERGEALPPWARWAGIGTFFLWALGVTAGKFLPYTHHILLVS